MNSTLSELKEAYNLEIESPFTIQIKDIDHTYACLIKGFGAHNGMVIEKEWDKLKVVFEELIRLGYGYSCFDIEKAQVDSFGEVLDDWGKLKV